MSSHTAVSLGYASTPDTGSAGQDAADCVLPLTPPLRADDELTVDELGARIVGLAGRISAATCRWLLLLARFDVAEGCARLGLPSTARWLSHTCGLSHRTAVEHVRVARGLAGFPLLAQRMAEGRLSYSHVRAITRLARPDEHRLVADLVQIAEHGSVGQLESVVRGLRTVDDNRNHDPGRNDEPPEESEYLSQSWGSDSRWRMHSRLDPENGALVRSALAAVARTDPDGGTCTAAEALVRMAEITLAVLNDSDRPPRLLRGEERAAIVVHLDATVPGATPEAATPQEDDDDSSDDAPKDDTTKDDTPKDDQPDHDEPDDAADHDQPDHDQPDHDQPDYAADHDHDQPDREPDHDQPDYAAGLGVEVTSRRKSHRAPRSAERGGHAGPERAGRAGRRPSPRRLRGTPVRPRARIGDGPGLPERVVRRLLCSGRIRTVIRGARPPDLWNLGRAHRVVTDRLFRALVLRDGGCAHPGCGSRYGMEAHHVRHWIDGGPTHPDNLVLLCLRHHHAHHDGAFSVVRARDAFEFRRADGCLLPHVVDPTTLTATSRTVEDAYADLAADAATTRWVGDRLDHGYAVAILADRREAPTRCA